MRLILAKENQLRHISQKEFLYWLDLATFYLLLVQQIESAEMELINAVDKSFNRETSSAAS
jgi:hypothetical protein